MAMWPLLVAMAGGLTPIGAQVSQGDALGAVKLSAAGGLPGLPFGPQSQIGSAMAALGDVDGDGNDDIALKAVTGGFYVVFMNGDGTVKTLVPIAPPDFEPYGKYLVGGSWPYAFTVLDYGDGSRVLAVSDLIADECIGPGCGLDYGMIFLAPLPFSGVIATDSWTVLTASTPVLADVLSPGDNMGASLCALDLDGDGFRNDLAVGLGSGEGLGSFQNTGSVVVLDLDPADPSVVLSAVEIAEGQAGFGAPLFYPEVFGGALAPLGDIDGDGVEDLAVGTPGDLNDATPGSGNTGGAVWILRLAQNVFGDLSVSGAHKIALGFSLPLGAFPADAWFGGSLANAGDVDGNGFDDLLVGATARISPLQGPGHVWLLRLGPAGALLAADVFGLEDPDLGAVYDIDDRFGETVVSLGDVDGDGLHTILAGAIQIDDGFENAGGVIEFFVAGQPGGQGFTALEGSLDGRPGRSALVLVPAPPGPGDELELEPVVVVPNTKADTVVVHSIFVATSGGIYFALQALLATGDAPAQASASDLAGDANLDIITANKGDGTVSFLLGTGAGTFAPHVDTLLPFDDAPVSLAAADMDADGDIDIVTAGDGGITVLSGDGVGGFTAVEFEPVAMLTDLSLGDVDGDGDIDVVAASGAVALGPGQEQGVATVLLNSGTGQLNLGSTFAFGKAVASILLLDADGDGDPDALAAIHELDGGPGGVPQGVLQVFTNQGGLQGGVGGAFLPSAVFAGHATPQAGGFHPTYGAVGDIDGDGDADAVYTSSDNIAFAPETFAGVQPPLALTVMTSDGAGDFVVASVGTPFVGKGVAPILTDFLPPPGGDGALDAILVFFADDLAGLVTGAASSQTMFTAALIGDGAGGFSTVAVNQFLAGDEPGEGDSGQIGVAGTNVPGSDGRDLVVPLAAANALMLALGDGAGGIAATTVYHDVDATKLPAMGAWEGGPRVARVARLNGDQVDDVVVHSQWNDVSGLHSAVPSSLAVFVGDGLGGLVPSDYVTLSRGGDLAIGDVTGDGRTDVLVTERSGAGGADMLLVFAGSGSGTLSAAPQFVAPPVGVDTLSGGLAVADADGDGDLDVWTTGDSQSGGTLILFRNRAGALSAESFAMGDPWGQVRGLDVGQLVGDAQPDVAIGLADGRLVVARADGVSGFVLHELSPPVASGGGGALRLGDIDGDGALDIVASGAASHAFVRVLLNDGNEGFLLQTIDGLASSGAFGPLRPILDDFDNDLTLDIALSHGSGNAFSILANELSTWETLGSGKPGSGGHAVSLQGFGYTTPGGSAAVSVSGGLGGAPAVWQVGIGKVAGPGFLHIGAVLIEIPLALGGAPGLPGDGAFAVPITIPNDSRLLGIELVMQFLVLDPGAGPPGPGKISASNGLALTIVP